MIEQRADYQTRQRYGIIASRFNAPIVEEMLQGAKEGFAAHHIADDLIDIVHVPGAFELPVVAESMAASGRYRAVIGLGVVIRGETAHFDYVAGASADGLAQVALKYGLPVIFGVLTTENVEQALERAERQRGNKGFEMALAALETAQVIDQVVRNEI